MPKLLELPPLWGPGDLATGRKACATRVNGCPAGDHWAARGRVRRLGQHLILPPRWRELDLCRSPADHVSGQRGLAGHAPVRQERPDRDDALAPRRRQPVPGGDRGQELPPRRPLRGLHRRPRPSLAGLCRLLPGAERHDLHARGAERHHRVVQGDHTHLAHERRHRHVREEHHLGDRVLRQRACPQHQPAHREGPAAQPAELDRPELLQQYRCPRQERGRSMDRDLDSLRHLLSRSPGVQAMIRRVIVAAIAAAALAPFAATAPAVASTSPTCNGPSCSVDVSQFIKAYGSGYSPGGSSNVVPVNQQPPPCLWNPIGDQTTGSQYIISQFGDVTPADSLYGVYQSVQQAKQLLKDGGPPGTWYVLPINPAAGPSGAVACLQLPLFAFVQPGQVPPMPRILAEVFAEFAWNHMKLASPTVTISPATKGFVNLATFVWWHVPQTRWVTAELRDGSQAATVVARVSDVSIGTSPAGAGTIS